jgi:ABC-type multidrug transport system ATPase subunit/ABC-type multidrug transport system permease subunit
MKAHHFPPQSLFYIDDIIVQDDHIMAMGGLDTVDLGFSDIRMELETKKKNANGDKTRVLLDGSIRGRAQPGRMMAIMGPSGAGKSTVLHALAGRIKGSSKIALEGTRHINGNPVTGDSMLPSAFIEQEVNFFPHMTIRETLNFRVELKLGSRLSKKARDTIVNDLIAQLRLEKAADTIVGDAKVRGISGGERRRLSIACELVSSPSLIFLDEPTSGLDSTAATSLVEVLRSLADAGKTIIAVIHQPSQHVFAAFDDLLLVSEGKQMYFGDVHNVRNYMEEQGCKAPSEMGTAEHILDCISKDMLIGETEEDAVARIKNLGDVAKDVNIDIGKGTGKVQKFAGGRQGGPKANILIQFKLLLKRALRENFRGKTKLVIQVVQQVSLGVIYGGIYSIGTNQASIQDRFGVLSLIAIGAANMAMASTLRAFPKEKAIVANEIGAKMYDTLPYFIGKALSEIPQTFFFSSLFGVLVSFLTGLNTTKKKLRRFLGLNSLHSLTSQSAGLMIGAVSPSSDAALAIFPAIMVLNIIFDGKNISEENTPRLLRWLPKVGLIRWGFEGLCLNEFEDLKFDTSGPQRGPVAKTGVDALSRFGMADKKLGDVVKAQVMITSACWFLSYLGLTLTRQKYQIMEMPEEKNGKNGKAKEE